MANIQIRGEQVKDATLPPGKLDLTQTYDFTSGVVQVATPSNGSDAATKDYVDSQLPDAFSAGDGIAIDTTGDPDVISVKLAATNPALQFVGTGTDELQVKFNSTFFETGGLGLDLKAGVIGETQLANNAVATAKIGDAQVTNAKLAGSISNDKLANSTISGKALGSNLDSLSAAASSAISMSSYDGSAAVSNIDVKVDGVIVIKDGSGNIQLADSSVGAGKLAIGTYVDKFTANGSDTAFDLAETVPSEFAYIQVFKNGLFMEQVASSPSGKDEFSVSLTGGAAGVTQINFGSAPTNGDLIRVLYIA